MRSSAPPVPTRPTGLGADPSLFESAFDRLTDVVDQIAPGARGEIVHQYLMRNGYFDDPERAAALFQGVPEIDSYLDQINVSKASQTTNQGLTGSQVAAATIGFGLGLGVAYLVSSATSSAPSNRQRRLEGR